MRRRRRAKGINENRAPPHCEESVRGVPKGRCMLEHLLRVIDPSPNTHNVTQSQDNLLRTGASSGDGAGSRENSPATATMTRDPRYPLAAETNRSRGGTQGARTTQSRRGRRWRRPVTEDTGRKLTEHKKTPSRPKPGGDQTPPKRLRLLLGSAAADGTGDRLDGRGEEAGNGVDDGSNDIQHGNAFR